MYRRFHDRFGTAGVVLGVIALIAALGGTAFAASGALTGKQKKEVEKIAKKYQGTGPAGAAGAAGKEGTNGKDGGAGTNGTPGTPGTNGTNGKTVLNGVGAPDGSLGTNGDFYIDTTGSDIYGPKAAGDWGFPTSLKGTNGTNGTDSPFAGGTLAPGVTETGAFSSVLYDSFGVGLAMVPVSFNVPLAAPISDPNLHIVGFGTTPPAECDNGADPAPSAANPEADAGHFCVFVGTDTTASPNEGVSINFILNPSAPQLVQGLGSISKVGAYLHITGSVGQYATGTWAVTG